MRFDRRAHVDIQTGGSTTALRVEGLRIAFDIKKDAKPVANRGRITLYNLAPDTRAKIKELTDTVVLRAGYADEETSEVFRGDIVSVSHVREGADFVTRIEANDGQTALRGNFVSLSYLEGQSMARILKDILKAMGLPVKYIPAFTDQRFLQGFAFAGPAREALDKVTARAGLEWSIQGGALKILQKGNVDAAPVLLVSAETGMIGSPERIQQLKEEGQAEKRPPGWKVASLLHAPLEPGGRIAIRSREIPKPTAFRIETVHHQGDTHGEAWMSTVEAVEPGILL